MSTTATMPAPVQAAKKLTAGNCPLLKRIKALACKSVFDAASRLANEQGVIAARDWFVSDLSAGVPDKAYELRRLNAYLDGEISVQGYQDFSLVATIKDGMNSSTNYCLIATTPRSVVKAIHAHSVSRDTAKVHQSVAVAMCPIAAPAPVRDNFAVVSNAPAMPQTPEQAEQIARNLRKATDAINAVRLDVEKSAAHYRICERIPGTETYVVERIGGNKQYRVNMRTQTCTCDCARTHTVRYNGYFVAAGSPERYRCKHVVLASESLKAMKAEGLDLFPDTPRVAISRETMERDFA